MADIIPIGQQMNNIDPRMRQRMAAAAAANKSLASNVVSSYPMLSIRGKEFTFRLPDGRSSRHEQNGFAMPYIDVVIVEGSPLLSKTYYEKGFDPNEFARPDCWSLDSVKPDPSSPALQPGWAGHPTGPVCATCPQNVFGSKVSDAGKKIKACSDYRRVVVLMPHQIGAEMATPMGMRIPQSSLKNLKAHAELLMRYGVDYKAAISRLSFTNEAFPQLQFTYVSVLTEQQWDWVQELAASPLVQGMVFTPDFENAVSTPDQETPEHNKGLQQLEPGPIPQAFNNLMGMAQQEEEPDEVVKVPLNMQQGYQQAKPDPFPKAELKTVFKLEPIELPDGRWFDPNTKQYVEAPTPKVEMPAMDPATMELPDGKFFNTNLKAYVTGPEVGAPPAGAEPAAPKKRVNKPKAATPPPAEQQAQANVASQEDKQQATQAAKPAGNGGVKPASDAMNEVLRAALQET